MATNLPPVAGPGGVPPRKKTSPLVWILVGIAGFFLLLVMLVVAGGFFVMHKARQAGLDPELMRRNPGLAMAKLITAANPDAEVVKVDEGRGIITVKDKKTGKTVTMNFEDVRRGRMSFQDETGQKVSIETQGDAGSVKVKSDQGTATFGAGPVTLPAWLPAYAGVTPQGSFTAQSQTSDTASFHFTTRDSPDQVFQFYEAALKKAGLKVSTFKQDKGGIVSGQDQGEQRTAIVTIATDSSGTQVNVTVKSKK